MDCFSRWSLLHSSGKMNNTVKTAHPLQNKVKINRNFLQIQGSRIRDWYLKKQTGLLQLALRNNSNITVIIFFNITLKSGIIFSGDCCVSYLSMLSQQVTITAKYITEINPVDSSLSTPLAVELNVS